MLLVNQLSGFASGGGIGGNDSSTKLLNHFDTDLSDSSSVGFTWTATGSAAPSATQYKFGGKALSLNGSSQYLSGTYSTTNHDWWTSDFTIDCWVYYNSFTGASYVSVGKTSPTLVGNSAPGTSTNYWSFGGTTGGKIAMYYYNGTQQDVVSSTSISTGVWTHIAMKKNGSGISLAVNGTWESAVAISGTPQSNAGTVLSLGCGNGNYTNAYVDELRISRTERWAGNFTPPSEPYG